MKLNLILLVVVIGTMPASGQTLYVPNGTSGIGGSGNAGKVGVNTSSPAEALEVVGNLKTDGDIYSTSLGATRVGFLNAGAAASPSTYYGLYYDSGHNVGVVSALSGGVAWRNLSLAPSGGKVGIGNLVPNFELDVTGGVHFGNGTDNVANCPNGFSVQDTTGDTAIAVGASTGRSIGLCWRNNGGSGSGMGWLYTFSSAAPIGFGANYFIFQTTQGDVMSITNTGNVGIGTDAPDSKLTVKGVIHAEEVVVDMAIASTFKARSILVQPTAWADNVFESTYKLEPLANVEKAIHQTGHLPGVPSAKEVAEKGVSVGDMQAVLLAKIEELTLHQIEQEKEIAQLRSQLADKSKRQD